MMYVASRSRGMGDAAQGVAVGASIGTPVVTGVLASSAASSAAAAGTTAEILGMQASVAIPIIGAAIAGVSILAQYLIRNSGCGPTCVQTSSWANQAAQLLDQNIHAYFASSPRTKSQQAAALETFDNIWSQLQKLCSQPSVGNAGVRCISDRQSGACTWKQTADKVPSWGTPAAGECWNWFSGYRDPIANDPDVVSDSQVVTSQVSGLLASVTGGSTSGLVKWGLILALAGGAVWAVTS